MRKEGFFLYDGLWYGITNDAIARRGIRFLIMGRGEAL